MLGAHVPDAIASDTADERRTQRQRLLAAKIAWASVLELSEGLVLGEALGEVLGALIIKFVVCETTAERMQHQMSADNSYSSWMVAAYLMATSAVAEGSSSPNTMASGT